jgi:hypothetical protein
LLLFCLRNIRAAEKAKKKKKLLLLAQLPAGPTQEELLTQIRDLLKNKEPLYYMFNLTIHKTDGFPLLTFCYFVKRLVFFFNTYFCNSNLIFNYKI